MVKTTQLQSIQTEGPIYNKTAGRGNADSEGPDEVFIEKQNQHYGFRSIPPANVEHVVFKDNNLTWSVAENDGDLPSFMNKQSSKTGDVAIYNNGADVNHGSYIYLFGNGNTADSGAQATILINSGGTTIDITDIGFTIKTSDGVKVDVLKDGGISLASAKGWEIDILDKAITVKNGSAADQFLVTNAFITALTTLLDVLTSSAYFTNSTAWATALAAFNTTVSTTPCITLG